MGTSPSAVIPTTRMHDELVESTHRGASRTLWIGHVGIEFLYGEMVLSGTRIRGPSRKAVFGYRLLQFAQILPRCGLIPAIRQNRGKAQDDARGIDDVDNAGYRLAEGLATRAEYGRGVGPLT